MTPPNQRGHLHGARGTTPTKQSLAPSPDARRRRSPPLPSQAPASQAPASQAPHVCGHLQTVHARLDRDLNRRASCSPCTTTLARSPASRLQPPFATAVAQDAHVTPLRGLRRPTESMGGQTDNTTKGEGQGRGLRGRTVSRTRAKGMHTPLDIPYEPLTTINAPSQILLSAHASTSIRAPAHASKVRTLPQLLKSSPTVT